MRADNKAEDNIAQSPVWPNIVDIATDEKNPVKIDKKVNTK